MDPDSVQQIRIAAAKPTLIFAAAANHTIHQRIPIRFPARLSEVFCIFSAKENGAASEFNPPSKNDRANFMFPGEDIEGAWPDSLRDIIPENEMREENGRVYRRLSGTSCATPIAAAVAAGILEFAWQVREHNIEGVGELKHRSGMDQVFRKMLDKYQEGEYHYVKP